jgi:soluble lytic murein transglycosylase-like protein
VKKLASWLAASALAVVLLPAARAEVWGYVDDKGVAHFASDKVDERYELFFRALGQGASPGTPRAVAVPTAPPRLIAFFEVSPDYKQVQHHLRAASRTYGVDYELLKALIATESGFDASVVSPRGAVGLMQIMPTTAEYWGIKGDAKTPLEKKLADPAINIETGTRYLRYLLDRFAGQLELALAAYNAGVGSVLRAGSQVPNLRETQNYVKTVMQLYAMLRPPAALTGPGSEPVRVRKEIAAVAAPALPVVAVSPNYPFE